MIIYFLIQTILHYASAHYRSIYCQLWALDVWKTLQVPAFRTRRWLHIWHFTPLKHYKYTRRFNSPATSDLVNCFKVAQILINSMLETAERITNKPTIIINVKHMWKCFLFYNGNMITVLTCLLGNQYPCHPHWQELYWGLILGRYGPDRLTQTGCPPNVYVHMYVWTWLYIIVHTVISLLECSLVKIQ